MSAKSMKTHFRFVRFSTNVIVLLMLLSSPVSAGWLEITNSSGRNLIIQELVSINGQTRREKPHNLHNVETLRIYLPTPTIKQLEVFDVSRPTSAVWSGSLTCGEETQSFCITSQSGRIGITGKLLRK
jgi:hypothetical protein